MIRLKPSSFRRSSRHSFASWALRGVLASGACVLGYISTTQTFAYAVSKSDPQRAYAIAPGDGRIAGALAQQLAVVETGAPDRALANRLARQGLAAEPLSVKALTALALNAQIDGKTAEARRLFAHSDALSRRELGTRLWLIEDAVGRNDIKGALRHYDIALRTEKNAPDLLFPVLAQAITDPAISGALADVLQSKPAWGETFITYLATSGEVPTASAILLRNLSNRGVPVNGTSQTGVVNLLFRAGKFDESWNYYRSFRANVDRRRSRDPHFALESESPSIFDWVPIMNEAGVSASIQHAGGKDGMFDFAAPSSTGGVVLQQVQLLPPGHYRLDGVSAEIEQPDITRPYWRISCLNSKEVGRIELPNSSENRGHFMGFFEIPVGCPVQTLDLVARPSSEVGGTIGQILHAALVPMQKKE